MLGDAPAPDHGDDGADRERAGAAARAASEKDERGGAAQQRRDHERQSVARQAVVDVPRVVAQREDAGHGEDACRHGGRQRSGGEVALEVGGTGAPGVADEEHGRQVRRRGDEERPDQHRERIQPAGDGIAGSVAGGHAARRDGADHGSHEERREQRREAEEALGEPTALESSRRLVEREPGPPQHDAERGEAERYEQRGEDRLERGRERRPEHHEDEDQPDVVGFPHRADRPVDQLARAPAAAASAGDQAPEPGPEVRSAEHHVRRQARPQHPGDGVGRAHCGASGTTVGGTGGDGP